MTAFNLKLADAAFASSLRGIRLPNRRKLAGEYVFGVSEAESIKNRADPSRPLTVQGGGSITYTSVSAHLRSSLTAGYGFLTGLVPNVDATLLFIRKGGSGTQMFQAGIASPIWCGFRAFGTTNYGSNGEPANNQGANRPSPGATDVYFEALVLSDKNNQRGTGGYGKLYYYSGGVQQVATSAQLNTALKRGALYQKQIAIGSNLLTDSITTSNFDAYFFALIQRPLSPSEIDDDYLSLKADYATRGVTLL